MPYIKALSSANTIDELKDEFGKAWGELEDSANKASVKDFYDNRKSALSGGENV